MSVQKSIPAPRKKTIDSPLQSILDSCGHGIMAVDNNFSILFANKNLREMLGYSLSELNAADVRDILKFVDYNGNPLNEDNNPLYEILSGYCNRRESMADLTGKSGQVSLTLTTLTSLKTDSGKNGAVINISDMTDLRKTTIELENSEMRYRNFVQKFEGIAFRSTLDFKPVFFHGAVREITGYDEDEFIEKSMTIENVVHPEDVHILMQRIKDLENVAGQGHEYQYRIIRKDGSTRWISEYVQKIRDEEGYSLYIQGTIYDITERKLAEAELEELNRKLEKRVEERTAKLREEIEGREGIETALLDEKEKIQSILDNAGQGFLTFGKNLKIDLEYSEECRNMFGGEIWGKTFPDIAFPEDSDQRGFLCSILKDIFEESESERRKIFFSLLPSEIHINNKYAHVEYKEFITPTSTDEQKLLVILTDVTEKRKLESQLVRERNFLKMIVKAVTNNPELYDAVNDYRNFCTYKLEEILETTSQPEDAISEIYRVFHTFKGTFGQLELIHIIKELNDLETRISQKRGSGNTVSRENWIDFFKTENPLHFLDQDLEILSNTLGQEYFERKAAIQIEPTLINEIEEKMISMLSPIENRYLLPYLRKLRYTSFKNLLRTYPEYTMKLAERLEKQIKPVFLEGDDLLIDPNRYLPFTKTLVHVFRNAIDHGIESDEERLQAGKDEFGFIKCGVTCRDNIITLRIDDDGRGIDIEKLKKAAVEKAVCLPDDLERMEESEILNLIFTDQLTTRRRSTEISGRGVGLSAVKRELDKINGSVRLETSPGKGTTFIFRLPIVETVELPQIYIPDIVNPIIVRAKSFMTEEMKLTVCYLNLPEAQITGKLRIRDITALIGIRGAINGLCALSFDDQLARYLVEQFSLDQLTQEEIEDYLEDTMAEITNTVLGNTLNIIPEIGNLVTIGTPATIMSSESALRYTGSEIWSCELGTEHGDFSVSVLISGGS